MCVCITKLYWEWTKIHVCKECHIKKKHISFQFYVVIYARNLNTDYFRLDCGPCGNRNFTIVNLIKRDLSHTLEIVLIIFFTLVVLIFLP